MSSTSPAAPTSIAAPWPGTAWLVGTSASPVYRAAALGLWLVWAGLLFPGPLTGQLNEEQTNSIPLFGRMGSSLVLVVAGLVGVAAAGRAAGRRYSVLIAVGMALGLLGDLFNADLVPLGLKQPVLGAIVSFGIGHLAYIAACRDLFRRTGWWNLGSWGPVCVWQAVGLLGWAAAVYLAPDDSPLKWPALPYSLLLAGTAGVTTALARADWRFLPLALGGALFLASDLVLAVRLFHGSFYRAGDAVWLLYGPAQMLITYSIWPALDLLNGLPPSEARKA